MIKVIYSCGGCNAEETVVLPWREFRSLTGKSYGFGSYSYPQVKDNAPEGWMAYDTATGCCYCPACGEGLEAA